MVRFTISDMERVMSNPNKVRNLSVIAHVDHGKSTLTDSLFAGAGAIRMDQAGNRRVTDDRKDEELRCITIKSTGISLLFPESEYIPHETVLNVIDSPGHVDFSSEVTAALRATDGAIVVVDCVEGVCVQTETVLRQALQEMIRPVLVINKLDRFFLELKYDPEEIFQRLARVIESVNVIISTYQSDNMEDFTLDPAKGNVAFAAGLMGWGFTLPQLADFYSKRQEGSNAAKILRNLWGERFVNMKTGKWSNKAKSDDWTRGFNELVIRPIQTVFESCTVSESIDWGTLNNLLPKLEAELSTDQRESLKPKEVIKCVMQQWIPAHICLLDLAVNHLPSPIVAQKYRVDSLYTGPLDDETAESIRSCDPDGPLVVYISKMAPERADDRNARFLAFGRVFSGTVKPGQRVTVLSSNYVYGQNANHTQNVPVTRVCAMIPKPVAVTKVCAGNTVSLVGLDSYIIKTATIVDKAPTHPIKNMTFSVAAVVQRSVAPAKPSDIPKLTAAMAQLSTSDSLVQCFTNAAGEHIIAGAGELHLEICLNDLQSYMGESKLIVRDPIVSYCETVTETSKVFLGKSPNRHNRLFIRASPMNDDLVTDILQKEIDVTSVKTIGKTLSSQYAWTPDDAKNAWGFFPVEGTPTNCFVNSARGVQYVNEVQDSVRAALEWFSQFGPLIEGEMQGIRFDLTDALLHADSIHRSGAQIIPAARKTFAAAYLDAKPRLMEPVYLVEISCPRIVANGCHQTLGKRRSSVFDETPREGTDLVVLKAYLPVAESFGFSQALRAATGGQAFPQMIFDHWQFVPGDPLEDGSLANQIVKQIRERKGLSPELPDPANYADAQ